MTSLVRIPRRAFLADLVETIVRLVASGRIAESRLDESIERLDILAFGTAIE